MSPEPSSLLRCQKCGEPLPDNKADAACPICLMSMVMRDTQSTLPLPAAQTGKTLTVEELAPLFPQLELLELIGRGGMGVVYKARQKSLNRLVALKLLAPVQDPDRTFAERFVSEARALAALDHPNIVTVYDFGEAGGSYYILMEYVDGVNLRQAMQSERLTPQQALKIVPPVCEALQFAHDHGIVHRDIKPENLLLNKEGRVKIADFGIAKIIERTEAASSPAGPSSDPASSFAPSAAAKSTIVGGTPQYMAPEQRSAPGTADHRADIYSLGVVLYELLTGELPKKGNLQPPSKHIQVDVRLDEIVMRALEKTPELRFQTAGDMRTQLATLMTLDAAKAAPAEAKPKPKASWMAIFTRAAILLILMAFVVVAFFVGSISRSRSTASTHPRRVPAQANGGSSYFGGGPGPIEHAYMPDYFKSSSTPFSSEVNKPNGKALDPSEVRLQLRPKGAYETLRSYRPMALVMSSKMPETISKIPEGLEKPWFGQWKIGPREARTLVSLVLEELPGKPSRLFVDSNANGDLTDDPLPVWDTRNVGSAVHPNSIQNSGTAMVPVRNGDERSLGEMQIYALPHTPGETESPQLTYYQNWMRMGKTVLGGKEVTLILRDMDSDGDFRTDAVVSVFPVDFGIERSRRKEDQDIFEFNGRVYETRDMNASGDSFKCVAIDLVEHKIRMTAPQANPALKTSSSASAKPSITPVSSSRASTSTSFSIGNPAPEFEATNLDGAKLQFPRSFAGKVMLLDFWATWCGPCMGQLPHLRQLYQKHHHEGFEILGVSLDSEEGTSGLPAALKKNDMTWPQICDGLRWTGPIVRLYKVSGIPTTVLVDGTSGRILAISQRGEALETAVKEALTALHSQK